MKNHSKFKKAKIFIILSAVLVINLYGQACSQQVSFKGAKQPIDSTVAANDTPLNTPNRSSTYF